jgi:hypothetical protein
MLFGQLIDQILHLQPISKLFRACLTAQIAGPDTVEDVDPLMKTVLRISVTTSQLCLSSIYGKKRTQK